MAGRREEAEGGAGQVASLVMMRRQAGPGGRGGRGRAGPGGGPVTKSDTPGPRLRYDSVVRAGPLGVRREVVPPGCIASRFTKF